MPDNHDKKLVDRHVRLDPKLYKKAVKNAKKANLSFNQYLNVLISKGKITYKYSDEKAEAINQALIYLHRNVNQLNIKLNQILKSSTLLDFEVEDAIKDLQNIKKDIDKVGELYVDKKRGTKRS